VEAVEDLHPPVAGDQPVDGDHRVGTGEPIEQGSASSPVLI
jgi:hypothetical protein